MAVHSRNTDDGTTYRGRRSRSRWLVPGILLSVLIITVITIASPTSNSTTTGNTTQLTATRIVSPTPVQMIAAVTATPVVDDRLILVPTSTPVLRPTVVSPVPIPLPTVTPLVNRPTQPITRTISISGTTTLRMAVAGANFESSGQPVGVGMSERVFLLDSATKSAADSWCLQLGLVNLLFDVSMQLNSENAGVVTQGEIQLRDDFCNAPGRVVDTADLAIEIPADAAVQLSYTLRGDRNLLGLSGLLDTHTHILIELILGNRRQTDS